MTEVENQESGNLIGKELDGKYFIVRTVGKGAMGVVYEALHTGIDRKLAVKVLNPDVTENEEILERFKREARLTGKLGHENIIEITDTGKTPGGSPYLVMEFLEGQALGQAIFADGPFSPARAVGILAYVLDALAVVHDAGVIHRDIKPDNIFLSEQGRAGKARTVVKLLDFGISKPVDSTVGENSLTQTGIIMGTPYYMAPEQVRGKELDNRADLYAIGVILYEALTTHLPYNGDNFGDLFASIITDNPRPPSELVPGISEALDAVVMKAFAREKEDRYRSADELLMALEPYGPPGLITRLCDSRGVCIEAIPELPPLDRMSKTVVLEDEPKKGNPLLLAALVVVAVVMIGLVGFLALGGGDGDTAAPPGPNETGRAASEERGEPSPAAITPEPSIQVPSLEVSQAAASVEPGSPAGEDSSTSADGGADGEQHGDSAASPDPDERPRGTKRPRDDDRHRPGRGERPARPPRPPQQLEIDTNLPPTPVKRVPIQEIDLAPPPGS